MNEAKDKLTKEKEDLEKQLAMYKSEDPLLDTEQNISYTSEDDVTAAEGHDRLVATRIELRKRLVEVNDALGKIESGKYGTCETCGKEISKERLGAMPSAKFCIECKAKQQ
jgi:DnaK suppressor protein